VFGEGVEVSEFSGTFRASEAYWSVDDDFSEFVLKIKII
jgi:hypothetical protein